MLPVSQLLHGKLGLMIQHHLTILKRSEKNPGVYQSRPLEGPVPKVAGSSGHAEEGRILPWILPIVGGWLVLPNNLLGTWSRTPMSTFIVTIHLSWYRWGMVALGESSVPSTCNCPSQIVLFAVFQH